MDFREVRGPQTAGNALQMSILPPPRYFCIILKSFTSLSGGPFWLFGGGEMGVGLTSMADTKCLGRT